MKPSEEQAVMLEHIRQNLDLPANYRDMATKFLEQYDPVKHAELDQSIKAWESDNQQ